MLVTMAIPISSFVKDKNSIFTARDEDMIFLVKGKILVFHQYLYNKGNSQLIRKIIPCMTLMGHRTLMEKPFQLEKHTDIIPVNSKTAYSPLLLWTFGLLKIF